MALKALRGPAVKKIREETNWKVQVMLQGRDAKCSLSVG